VRFELHGADIAQRLMQSLPIIEHLDEFEHLRPGLLPRAVVPVMDQLVLQRTEEALGEEQMGTFMISADA